MVTENNIYNAADDLIRRNLEGGRAEKAAFIDRSGHHSYREVAARTARFANSLERLGLRPEDRVILAMDDSVDLVACFLGAMKAGMVPIPLNTRLVARDYAYILQDSGARALVVTEALLSTVLGEARVPEFVLVDGGDAGDYLSLHDVTATAPEAHESAPTTPDSAGFWLYTSGTTGAPKGVVHLHSHLAATADLYAGPILNIAEDDVLFSAAKLFFAYGLGNGLTFPMAFGACAVLLAGPPDASAVSDILRREKVTVFFGVPTLYAMLLASEGLPVAGEQALRLCVSAGEPLPEDIAVRWRARMGVDILDGLGTTEMLHIFLSNRIGAVVPGSTGRAVPGYELRLLDEDGAECAPGEIGVLEVSGPSAALMYRNQREKTKQTFRGPWTRTGDNFTMDEDGIFTYGGRNDDMLKVGGIYVSPFEVEGALAKHASVLEAAVVGAEDPDGLLKPKAFVVLTDAAAQSPMLEAELQEFVRRDLAAYKRPRWIMFVDQLPKTATGKIKRFELRR